MGERQQACGARADGVTLTWPRGGAGNVAVTIEGRDGLRRELALPAAAGGGQRLQRGETFGEGSLLWEEKRPATVVAGGGGAELLEINRQACPVSPCLASLSMDAAKLRAWFRVSRAELQSRLV